MRHIILAEKRMCSMCLMNCSMGFFDHKRGLTIKEGKGDTMGSNNQVLLSTVESTHWLGGL